MLHGMQDPSSSTRDGIKCPLHWQHGNSTTGPPGKSQNKNIFTSNQKKNSVIKSRPYANNGHPWRRKYLEGNFENNVDALPDSKKSF